MILAVDLPELAAVLTEEQIDQLHRLRRQHLLDQAEQESLRAVLIARPRSAA